MKTKLTLIASMMLISLQMFSQIPEWMWAITQGTSDGNESLSLIATDSYNNIYATGGFTSSTMTLGATTLTNTSSGSYDIFIVKYDANGNVIWAKSVGSNSDDAPNSIIIDAEDNVYIAGHFFGSSITFGATTFSNAGEVDAFIAKYDSLGNTIWARKIGSPEEEFTSDITTDAWCNIYVGGRFNGPNLTIGAITLTKISQFNYSDLFIAKYDSAGNIIWAENNSSGGGDEVISVKTDVAGYFYTTGCFWGPSIVFGSTTLINAYSGGTRDIFTVKHDSAGNVLWAKRLGAVDVEEPTSLDVDVFGNVYVAGRFYSDSIIAGIDTLRNNGAWDIFLVKYDGNGNVTWGRSAGGGSYDFIHSAVMDISGNIYIAGSYSGSGNQSISFGSTTFNTSNASQAFIAKYDSSGNVLWAKSASGDYKDDMVSIAMDNSANIYVAGVFRSFSDHINLGLLNLPYVLGGYVNMFIAKLGQLSCSTNFTLFPDTLIPHHYWAINFATGVPPLTYSWNWGDGTSDSIAYPSHTYADAGFYTVCLTVYDSAGCGSIFCNYYQLQKMSADAASNTIVSIDVVDSIPSIPTNIQNTNVLQSWSVFPNPTSGNSFINYTLSTPATVSIDLYDVLGNKLQQLVNGDQEQGEHNAAFDAHKLANGVYVLQIRAGDQIAEQKVVLLR